MQARQGTSSCSIIVAGLCWCLTSHQHADVCTTTKCSKRYQSWLLLACWACGIDAIPNQPSQQTMMLMYRLPLMPRTPRRVYDH